MNAAGKSRRNASRSEHRHAAVRRRREQAIAGERARHRQARRRVRRRRITAGVGIVAAMALVAFGTVLVVHERNKPDLALRARSVAGRAPEQTIAKVPAAYRVSYRVETQTKTQPLTENVTVRRPFEMRYRIADEGKLDTPLYDLIVTKTHRTERNTGKPEAAERATPVLLPYGVRLDATLRDLVQNGFFTRRERRKLLDSNCTVYRTGAAIEGGEVTKPTATRYVDICVTDDGLVLEEVAVSSGKIELRVTATDVQRDLVLTDDDFPVSTDPVALAAGGVQVFDLDTSSTPTSPYWQWATVPSGWTLASRQRVEVTKLEGDATGPAATRVSWVDVYTRGADVVILRQGGLGSEPVAVDTTSAIDTPVGDLGNAALVIGTIGTKLIVANATDRFVHVFGTVSAGELTSLATTLKRN